MGKLDRRNAAQLAATSRRAQRRDKHEEMLQRHDGQCGPVRVEGRQFSRVELYRRQLARR